MQSVPLNFNNNNSNLKNGMMFSVIEERKNECSEGGDESVCDFNSQDLEEDIDVD